MANYSKITDYAAKDLLLHGDPAKAIKGAEVGAEFDAIATMSTTKAALAGSASQVFSVAAATDAAHAQRNDAGLKSYTFGNYTATATLTAADFGRSIYFAHGSTPGTLTLPSVTAAPVGSIIAISNTNAAPCTVARAGSAVIGWGQFASATSLVLRQGDSIILMTDGTNWIQVANCVSPSQAWVKFTVSGGVCTVVSQRNVTSVTYNAAGDYTVNFTVAMNTADYIVTGTAGLNTTSMRALIQPINLAVPITASCRVQTVSADGVLAESGVVYCLFTG